MSSRRHSRRRRSAAITRVLMIALAAVVFSGVVMQITMLARISGQQKAQAAVESEIHLLNTRLDNMKLTIDSFHEHKRVTMRAKQLGMSMPDETQIRVVNLPAIVEDTSTQSAEAIGAEEMN